MAISKNSVRVQFTLNLDKPKENQISEFLGECMDPNSSIKQIIHNYIVSNGGVKLPLVIPMEVSECDAKLLAVSKSDDINEYIVSNSEEKPHEVSELEINELDELSKFI
ncbi:hypothetical protein LGL55_05685 [Clostridium tagluense]|uniref:hypothetical protein n=1 Tax=Clostridium tagluense TaxID=360422 RepID=UPI001CF39AB9|nr:hypothetical protein [Clostridium tagluense]MCB2310613.1 hypothetical protein [Clostridium tagluense]MCB2315656.1 hypothetical protein [Clostridium tagluense]MCB2320510.1 hypothetical protein [Clostridium tagluense]MCB2325207.1 hypothetical protein [Clostridium tagluense]MCB2330059.1 hypothetical protein [Clostridium tagluense]